MIPNDRTRGDTLTDIGIALGAFALTALLAGVLGAANLGTALGIGQVAFALVATLVIVARR